MRLWSLHPMYLDSKGLLALWRESLLAQNVLLGKTKGYKNHPQLERFKASDNAIGLMAFYLEGIYQESISRKYNFNQNKIVEKPFFSTIDVTIGQISYEKRHLLSKLNIRDKQRYLSLKKTEKLLLHPLFKAIEGEVESWEVVH